jgi:hypothetical protein
MTAVTLIILSILAAALAYYIIMLAIRIRSNVATGLSYHDALLEQVSALRMGKMMTALGINQQRYIHQESGVDIDAQMKRCVACDNTAECDEKLAGDNIDPEHIEFCKNEAALHEITRRQQDTDNL